MSADKCSICDSTEHAFCGFCRRCKEHAEFVRDCRYCGEPAFARETCRQHPTDPASGHEPDESTEALSGCCGAAGDSYDAEPHPAHEGDA